MTQILPWPVFFELCRRVDEGRGVPADLIASFTEQRVLLEAEIEGRRVARQRRRSSSG